MGPSWWARCWRRIASAHFASTSPRIALKSLGLKGAMLEIALGHNSLSVPLARTYADVAEGEPVALVDSSGWLTLAVNRGDARDRFGADSGTAVRIRLAP